MRSSAGRSDLSKFRAAGLLPVMLWLSVKHRAQVRANGLTYSLHVNFVRQCVAIDDEVSRETDNVLRQWTRYELERAKGHARTRSARRASSSCTRGTPNTAMTASPTNFSTVPP
jgi:hypothetical protein